MHAQCRGPLGASVAPTRHAAQPPLPLPALGRRRQGALAARPGAVRCSQQHGPGTPQSQQKDQENLMLLGLKAVLLVSAAQAAVAALPPAAQAAGWRPRRHVLHRIRDKYLSQETADQVSARKAAQKRQAAAAQQQAAQAQLAATGDLQRLFHSAQHSLQRMWRQEPVYSVGISNRQQAYGGGRSPTPTAFGWLPLALAAGVALFLAFGRRLRLPWGGERRVQGGRWVRDRSLGGKMVFIADADLPASNGGPRQPRPLFEDDSAAGLGPAAGAGASDAGPWATAASGAASAASAAAAAAGGGAEPAWWNPPSFVVYCPASRKEELQRQAKLVLRQLEDGKMLQGLDYPVSSLVSLRTLCQEAGGFQVKPRTESGRDSMLRAGLSAALSAAQEGRNSLLGGDEPTRFVCGLAHDLGVPDKRAVTIVHAEVAAVCRAALIDAEAGYRSGNQSDLLMALIKVAGTLHAFPLPPGSAEAELVAAGVVKQTGLEFRKSLFFEFGAVSPQLASLVAEMLGFDPALVMPQLQAAAEQQQRRQEQQAAAEQ